MRKISIFLVVVLCMFSLMWAEEGPYDLTKVDIFSLKKTITGADISVYGVTVKTSLSEALKMLNKTEADIATKGSYRFLEVEPGFKCRLTGDKINALLVSEKFKPKLKGATAQLFDNIDTEEKFKTYVTKYFMKPDNYDSSSVAGFENNTITYVLGIKFVRFSSREGSTCTMSFQKI